MDGVPSCANSRINNKVYREEFGWEGYMVSDCDSVGDFDKFRKVGANNLSKAAALGIIGGLDVDCGESYVSGTQTCAR
jgi:beta-glucosidase-like glycosyl hydrolase